MVLAGLVQSLIIFALVSIDLFLVLQKPKHGIAKLLVLIYLEVLGIGIPFAIFIVKGLIIDAWYIPSILLIGSITASASASYVAILSTRQRRYSEVRPPLLVERLKMEHSRYLQYLNTLTWLIVFSIVVYITSTSIPYIQLQTIAPFIPIVFTTDVIGIVYAGAGLVVGILWPILIRMNLIENAMFKIESRSDK